MLNRCCGFPFVVGLLASLLAAVTGVPGVEAADKALRVGILSSGTVELRGGLEQSLLQGLQDQGYVEGKNLVIERRYSSAMMESMSDAARELADMKLDAIITTCSPSTREAKQATSSTPIVMVAVSDPVGQKIIASLARPGQNVTGLSSQAEDLLPKRLELLSAVLPKTKAVAVLANASNPVHSRGWQMLETAAQQAKLKLMRIDVRTGADLPAAINAAARGHAGALLVLPDDPLLYNIRASIVELASRHRLPDFYWASEYVEAGGLMSYGENLRGSYRSAAVYVDKLSKGARPSELPVSQPTRFELVINMKTATALGIKIPPSVLLRTDRLIE
jgi:putative tryptophan/tyrosine transport system substrate-binding protein